MAVESRDLRAGERLRRLWAACRPSVIPALLVVAVLDVYAVWFVNAEQTLYHADQVTYWSYSLNLSKVLATDPVAALGAVVRSVANNDLNLLPALPVACIMVVFGSSRLAYLLSVITVYGGATAVMLGVALRRFGISNATWLVPTVFLLVPTIWRPVFLGYLGLGGVALALAVLALVVPDPLSPKGIRTMAAAGVLLAVLALFRRWWGIWTVAFCVVVALKAAWDLARARPRTLAGLGAVLKGPFVFGAAAFGTLVVFAAPIMVQRATTDYADRFTAYALDGWPQRLAAAVGHTGLLGALVVVAGVAVLSADRLYRRTAAVLVLVAVLAYSLMVSIQDHSPQHWYLYDPSILLLVGIAADRALKAVPRRRRWMAAGAVVVVGALQTAAVFVPGFLDDNDTKWLPSDRVRPLVRNDLSEVDRLLTYLDHRYQAGSGAVYVLSSSRLLSDHVLAFANLSMGTDHPSVGGIIASAHVDRRDGFPRGLLLADAVVVTDPVQLHLPEAEQRVVAEPVRSFLDRSDIALAFRKQPVSFHLDDGVRAYVFERVRPNTVEDLVGLSARLREAYPDRPEIFAP